VSFYSSFYSLLNIDRTATPAEIRKAYLELARKYHPDLNRDSSAAGLQFKKILRAYEVLSDPHERRRYDENPSQFDSLIGEHEHGRCCGRGERAVWVTPAPVRHAADQSPDGSRPYRLRAGVVCFGCAAPVFVGTKGCVVLARLSCPWG
jgi:hypothetical protein